MRPSHPPAPQADTPAEPLDWSRATAECVDRIRNFDLDDEAKERDAADVPDPNEESDGNGSN